MTPIEPGEEVDEQDIINVTDAATGETKRYRRRAFGLWGFKNHAFSNDFVQGANTNGSVISTTTASYTDSDGDTGATATFAAMIGWQAPVSPVITTWMPFRLAAGDRGIRAITAASSGGITLATSYGGGALSAVLYRSLITIPNQNANGAQLIQLPSPGIRIYPGSCIWAVVRGTATASAMWGSFTIIER